MTDAAVQQESDQAQAPVLSGFLKLKGKNNPTQKGQKYLQRVIFTLIARHTAAMGQQTRWGTALAQPEPTAMGSLRGCRQQALMCDNGTARQIADDGAGKRFALCGPGNTVKEWFHAST
ncbi:hypothetical protein ACIKP7_18445 [Pseudomonas caricapapayae]|uniref:Uncharacterized protein n=1 Tax=Pseudomonas caricapapayae TaxID=46678 RepID=A0ACC7M3C3_9PSED